MKYLVNSQSSLEEITGRVKREFEKKKYIWVSITSGKRSLDANALSFHWYKEISEQGDMQLNDVRNYCKYHYGLPILAAAEPELSDTLRKALMAIDYEDRLEMMGKFKVTSLFTREEMTNYLDSVSQHFSQQGYRLTNREDIT